MNKCSGKLPDKGTLKYSKKYSSPKDAERHFHEVLSQMSIEDSPLEADIQLVLPVTTRSLIEAVKSLDQLKSHVC